MRSIITLAATIFFFFLLSLSDSALLMAQIEEPEVVRIDRKKTPLTEGLRTGLGFNVVVNNFGFGVGGEFRRVIGPDTEFTAVTRITGLRDASEQTFTDVFFGNQIIPNKFQRALGFPLMVGLRHRIFGKTVQDNYRFFVSGQFGPAAALSYPYFDDRNNNGFRESFDINNFEQINDIFSGLGQGDWHLGFSGEVAIAIDFGSNFANISTLRLGYFFYNFPGGIQIMQPNQPILKDEIAPDEFPFEVNPDGSLALEPFFDPQKFFGSPQISFTIGGMW